MYEYLPIEQVKTGDIIERVGYSSRFAQKGKLYIVLKIDNDGTIKWCNETGTSSFTTKKYILDKWKLVKTKPGSEAKPGDTIIRTQNVSGYAYSDQHIVGKLETVKTTTPASVYTGGVCIHYADFLVLCKVANPFKVGDNVRYIGPPDAHRPSSCNVKDIYKDAVYYTNDKACHYKYWELIPEIPASEPGFVDKEALQYILQNKHFFEDTPATVLNTISTANPIQQQEITMNPEKLAACISKAITEETKKVKVKTDFQNRKRFSGVIYNAAGKYVTTIYSNKAKKLEVTMQQPEYLGMTMVTHEAKSIVTTNIPLVITDLAN